jgi:hypothetical protein
MKIFSDLSKLDFSTKAGRDKVFAAVQYFASGERQRAEAQRYQKALQAFGGPGDFPAVANTILEKFHAVPSYDMGFEEIFDIRDFTGTNEAGFDILDVEDGLTFAKVALGDKALIFKMAGSKVSVAFDIYGGGLGWSRMLIDDKKYWTLEDNAVAFVNKAAEHKAACFYALIEAIAAAQNVAWHAPDPAALAVTDALYTANRDAQTLNTAAETILLNIKDKGYGVTAANATFTVLAPLQIVGRLNKALGLLLQGFAGSPSQVGYKFRLIPTTMLATTTVYYVCLPKIKAKGGNRMNLTIFNKFDEEAYADVAVGWMRYGGAIGDQEQFQRCAIS